MGLKKKIKKELIGTSDYPSNKIFTISNFITAIRLILTLVFLYLFINNENRYVALVIYAIAASTDWLDGQIARMTKTVSWLGKMMDPVVDRALLFTGVLGLVARGELPLWVCVVIIGRDVYLACGNFIVRRYHRRPIDVVYTGKIATALLMTGFSLMLLGLPVLDGFDLLPAALTQFPGLNGSSVPIASRLSLPLSTRLKAASPLDKPSFIPKMRMMISLIQKLMIAMRTLLLERISNK